MIKKNKKTKCSALIQPHFDYACSSWYSGLKSRSKKQLQICQIKIIRFILGLDPRSHIGQAEREKVNMLSVMNRVKELELSHAHNTHNNREPTYLAEHFHRKTDTQTFRTRNKDLNFCMSISQGPSAHTFYHTAIKDWNSLPKSLQSIESKHLLKAALRKYLQDEERATESNDCIY